MSRRYCAAVASRTDIAWVGTQFVLFAAIAVLVVVTSGDGPGFSTWLGGVLVLAGLAPAGAALGRLGPSLSPYPTPSQGAILVMNGPFRLVRHPIYGGVILTALGLSFLSWSVPALVVSLALVPFFLAKASFEESMLVERFEGYADYMETTRHRLIPWLV